MIRKTIRQTYRASIYLAASWLLTSFSKYSIQAAGILMDSTSDTDNRRPHQRTNWVVFRTVNIPHASYGVRYNYTARAGILRMRDFTVHATAVCSSSRSGVWTLGLRLWTLRLAMTFSHQRLLKLRLPRGLNPHQRLYPMLGVPQVTVNVSCGNAWPTRKCGYTFTASIPTPHG